MIFIGNDWVMTDRSDWRSDSGLTCHYRYKKAFAFVRVKSTSGTVIWMKNYYKKYMVISKNYNLDDDKYFHTDFAGIVTEEEFLIGKLAGSL